MTYSMSLYGNNGTDTNFNVYNSNFTVVPAPIGISNLSQGVNATNSLAIQWSYNTSLYSVGKFLVVVFDRTNLKILSVLVDPWRYLSMVGSMANYNFQLNSSSLYFPNFDITNQIIVAVYAYNDYGISPISNTLSIN